MTADQSPARTPQVGDTITTAAELDALPAGAVLRDTLTGCVLTILADDHDQPAGIEAVAGSSSWSVSHGLTVLFRPDAPQPAPASDAVERAARVLEPDAWSDMDEMQWFHEYGQDSVNRATADRNRRKRTSLDKARAALAAARAGEAEYDGPTYEQVWQAITGRDEPWGGCADREAVERVMALILRWAAQRSGEAVDRDVR